MKPNLIKIRELTIFSTLNPNLQSKLYLEVAFLRYRSTNIDDVDVIYDGTTVPNKLKL